MARARGGAGRRRVRRRLRNNRRPWPCPPALAAFADLTPAERRVNGLANTAAGSAEDVDAGLAGLRLAKMQLNGADLWLILLDRGEADMPAVGRGLGAATCPSGLRARGWQHDREGRVRRQCRLRGAPSRGL